MDRLPLWLQEPLERAGFRTLSQLDAAIDGPDDAAAVWRSFPSPVQSLHSPADLLEAVTAARYAARVRRRRVASADLLALAEFRHESLLRLRGAVVAELPPPLASSVPAGRRRWPTRFKQALASTEGADQRLSLERAERGCWAAEVATVITEAQLPTAEEALLASAPENVLFALGGSRRPTTLRIRACAWRRVRLWLSEVHGIPWPAHMGHMHDYIQAMLAVPCPRTWPTTVAATLAFYEKIGGVAEEARISTKATWLATIADAEQRLQGGGYLAAKAPLFPRALIASLELYVMGDHPRYRRALAWVRLIKVWTSMRTNDLQGLPPAMLGRGPYGPKVVLMRTKTTGPGKQVKTVPIFVDRCCWIADPRWIDEGADLWDSDDFNFGRDYFVPVPTADYMSVQHKMADYSSSSAMGFALLADLLLPAYTVELGWIETAEPLLRHGAHLYWTEHSERNCITSVAAALGIDKSRRDYLGRWQPAQSDEYVRTAGQVVAAVHAGGGGRTSTPARSGLRRGRHPRGTGALPLRAHRDGVLRPRDSHRAPVPRWAHRSPRPPGTAARMPCEGHRASTDPRARRGIADHLGPLLGVGDPAAKLPPPASAWRLPLYYPNNVAHYETYNSLDGIDYDARCKLCWTAGAPARDGASNSSADSSDDSSSTESG